MSGVQQAFKYTFGLSFPGSIKGQGSQVIDFRQVVEPVAELMAAAAWNKKRVLYDLYHRGKFARPALARYLPAEYLCCELVVVFLCRDYIDRQWCMLEWEVIKSLAANRDQSRRVMYLWRGEMEERVIEELGLSLNSDGFLLIDGLEPRDIWQWVLDRYQADEADSVFASATSVVRQSCQDAGPLDGCSRLMILVQRAQEHERRAIADSRFMATTWLIQPSGESGKPFDNDRKDSTSETTFKLEELAASIVGWYSDVSNFIVSSGDRATHVLVCLILPAELLASASLHRLLRMIREQCQAEDDWDAEPPPPIVLACTERLEARVLSQDQFRLCGSQSQRRWRAADTTAMAISMEIAECCGDPSGSLSDLSWSLYCDDHPVHGNGVAHPSPQGLLGENHCVRPAGELQERGKPLCSLDETCAHHRPQSLYLSWHGDLAESQPDAYRLRILRILQSGVPMFLLDSPGLNLNFWCNGALSSLASDGDKCDHPLDTLLCWSHPELMRRISRYHKTFEAPACTSDAAAWSYLRHMIVFCDDHRYRPPAGSAFNSAFNVPFS